MENLSKAELIERVTQLESEISLLKKASGQVSEATEGASLAENSFKEFVSQLPLAAALFSPDGGVLKFNQKLIDLLGYTTDDIPTVEVHWPLFFPDPVYRKKVQEEWTEMLAESAKTGVPINPMLLDITSKNGEVKKLEVHSIQFGMYAITMWVDFTDILRKKEELKIAEGKSEDSENKFRALFDTLPTGITLADNEGQIIESNPAAEVILGLSKEEQEQRAVDGIEWSIIRQDGSEMPVEEYASVRALKENRLITGVEMGVIKGADNIAWLSVNAVPLKNHGVVIS